MYSTMNFHSTCQCVLCISSGQAKLCFDGESNHSKVEASVVSAGVGHRLLDNFNSDFEMVGSYAKGKNWVMCNGKEDEEEKIKGIRSWVGSSKIRYTKTRGQRWRPEEAGTRASSFTPQALSEDHVSDITKKTLIRYNCNRVL